MDGRDPGREYAIPRDNPFIDDPSALPEIYAYGFAQPWRCSVDTGDPQTGTRAGRIFCGDIGTADLVEEVNIIHKGGNYGYPAFEGDNCLVDNQTCNEGIIAISYSFNHNGMVCSTIHMTITMSVLIVG